MAIDAERLKQIELKYGGVFNAPRTVHSPFDKLQCGQDRGCDRMVYQNYAPLYARVLPDMRKPTVVEMGIFRGHGLAMWGDVYPEGDIIGLDVDPLRYENHRAELMALGAFPAGLPKVLRFDELDPESWKELEYHLEPGSVQVWIDDALHRTDVILGAWARAEKFMAPRSVYIIEDNDAIPERMHKRYDDVDGYDIITEGRLTAICKNP